MHGFLEQISYSPIEKAVFDTYKFNPLIYWIEISQYECWKEIATIALRIISIPPTEAAYERVFSARREIITKHVSCIHDFVVEAQIHLKAGLIQQFKKK